MTTEIWIWLTQHTLTKCSRSCLLFQLLVSVLVDRSNLQLPSTCSSSYGKCIVLQGCTSKRSAQSRAEIHNRALFMTKLFPPPSDVTNANPNNDSCTNEFGPCTVEIILATELKRIPQHITSIICTDHMTALKSYHITVRAAISLAVRDTCCNRTGCRVLGFCFKLKPLYLKKKRRILWSVHYIDSFRNENNAGTWSSSSAKR
jgi:hypothetical protein